MTELARLKFYATQPHSCSYLPDEQATTLFLDPSQPMDVNVYADLSEMGFLLTRQRKKGYFLSGAGSGSLPCWRQPGGLTGGLLLY